MSADEMAEIAREVVGQVVDAARHGESRGLTPELAACTVLGALKGLLRGLGPEDCARLAGGMSIELELLSLGQPLSANGPN